MMLGNLGQQAGSTSGVIDLPGAQHARTFQSAPGKSSFYARLEIHPPLVDGDEGVRGDRLHRWRPDRLLGPLAGAAGAIRVLARA